MTKVLILSTAILVSLSIEAQSQTSSPIDIKAVAADLEKRYDACPRREVVGPTAPKHHKQTWRKEGWGPPTRVFVDAKPNSDSVLYPFVVTVEYYLTFTFGPERRTQEEADKDEDLRPLDIPYPPALGGKYRNTYLVGSSGLKLEATEFLAVRADGTPDGWQERSLWPDSCWDQIQ